MTDRLKAKFAPAFSRDLKKKAAKRKWDLSELEAVIDLILENSTESIAILKQRHNMHKLTRESVQAGLAAVKPWGFLGDVSAAVNQVATQAGFTVVREFGGHGIGLEFHEDPWVGFNEEAGTGPILVPGMCFTIEPMVNMGAQEIDMTDPNGWTVRTADGKPTAQWEVQLVVTDTGYELISW